MAPRYRRHPEATWREVGDDLFLANPAEGTLHRANRTIRALWSLLAEPTTFEEAVEVFQAAFPDEDEDELLDEVATMFDDLEDEGLIQEIE